MVSLAGIELVVGQFSLATVQLKITVFNHQMLETGHPTNRTITIQNGAVWINLGTEFNGATMTAAMDVGHLLLICRQVVLIFCHLAPISVFPRCYNTALLFY